MKLKGLLKGLCILGLTLLPIFFANAGDFYLNIPATISDSINENILTFIPSNNFIVNSQYQVFQVKGSGSYPRLQTVFWSNTGLYIISSCAGGYGCQNIHTSIQKQGYITKYCKTTYGNTCTDKNLNSSDFYSLDSYKTADYLYIQTNGDLQYFNFCFNYQSLNEAICFSVNEATNIYSNSKGFTYNPYISELGTSADQISSYFTQSPFTQSSESIDYYFSTGSCPTVGEFKSSSNLTPAVCYAGYTGGLIYTAGENTTIQAGSGLDLFETYALFSGNMTIQDWYDTYWTYYNNISFNPYPFYNKPKALLGLMVARQSAGLTRGYNGSYIILNYCYYVLNNISDNLETCIGPNVSNEYPGIVKTDQDKKDIIDMVNDNYTVHQPGSGSIFLDPSQGLGGGGSSWGDDKCDGIPCLFEKFYQMFTSSRINDVDFSQGGQGILPGYIALAFVIVVLFYVFKR